MVDQRVLIATWHWPSPTSESAAVMKYFDITVCFVHMAHLKLQPCDSNLIREPVIVRIFSTSISIFKSLIYRVDTNANYKSSEIV